MDKRIQVTNDSSVVSKCSMINQQYFDDSFLKLMVPKIMRRAPLINRGYYIRMVAVDKILKTFLKETAHCSERVIISLGAGFDTSYFRLQQQGLMNSIKYFEIDYYEVALRKLQIITASPELVGCLRNWNEQSESNIMLSSDSYYLLACDLNHISVVEACFRSLLADHNVPVLVFSECVLTYMTPKNSESVISWVFQEFPNSLFFLYEQVKPHDSFGKFMCSHFQKLGSPLRCISSYPSLKDQSQRFLDIGYKHDSVADLNQFYCILDEHDKQKIEKLEIFDEYEEWYDKCGHYFVLVAQTADFINNYGGACFANFFIDFKPELPLACCVGKRKVELSSCDFDFRLHVAQLARISLNNVDYAVRIGGYGKDPLTNGHRRLTSITVFDPFTSNICSHIGPVSKADADLLSWCQNSVICRLSDTDVVLFGGRISPLKPNNSLIWVHFSLDSDNCIQFQVTQLQSVGEVPSPRWRHCAAVAVCNGIQYLFVYGGRDSDELILNDAYLCEISLPDNKVCHWQKLNAPLPGHRSSAAMCAINNTVYLSCGLDVNLMPTSDIWQFSLTSRSWTPVSLKKSILPRFSHHMFTCEGKLFLMGGVSNWLTETPLALVEIDILSLTPTVYDFDLSALENTLWMVFNMAVEVFEHDNKKYALCVGGGGNCFSFGTHFNSRAVLCHLHSDVSNN